MKKTITIIALIAAPLIFAQEKISTKDINEAEIVDERGSTPKTEASESGTIKKDETDKAKESKKIGKDSEATIKDGEVAIPPKKPVLTNEKEAVSEKKRKASEKKRKAKKLKK